MGRPIQKKWFGLPSGAGNQVVVNAVKWSDSSVSTNAYIVKQTGDRAYRVSDGSKVENVFLVNAESDLDLQAGQCFITATPFGKSARPCAKITQYRVSVYEADGTIGNYSWSTIPAVKSNQADLNLA